MEQSNASQSERESGPLLCRTVQRYSSRPSIIFDTGSWVCSLQNRRSNAHPERIGDTVVQKACCYLPQIQKVMPDETEELAEQANEIFDRVIRPRVDMEEDAPKYVAIDTESEDFEIDADQRAASDRLLERHPEARGRIFFRRVGSPYAHHFGGGLRRGRGE